LTIIIYCNTLEPHQGGGTSFPFLNITVTPVKNSAVLFTNLNEDGTGDKKTLHSGDKLRSNETLKWIISSHSWEKIDELPYKNKYPN